MKTKVNKLDFNGMPIYVGIDVHYKQWKITTVTPELINGTFSQPPEPKALNRYLKRNFPGANYCAVYEAGCFGFWIHRELEALGIRTIVVNPADVPVKDKERKQKEDKRDSRKLAIALRANELDPIYIPSIKDQQDRQLVRTRQMFSKDLRRYKNRIKASLKFYGINLPERFAQAGTHWSRNFMQWLKSLEFEQPSANFAMDKLIQQCEHIREELLDVTRQIRLLSKSEPYKRNTQLLLSIPGIGLISAMVILTELINIKRFRNLDHLASYVGLIPKTNSSGEKLGVGGVTSRNNNYLRSLLIEDAWIAIKADPALSLKYHELVKRMKSNKAIIIITKKLLNRIRFVLKNDTEYIKSVVN